MAPVIQAKCPHCHTSSIGFTFVSETHLAPQKKKEWMIFYKCNRCSGGFVIEYEWQVDFGPKSPSTCNGDPAALGFKIVRYYPGPMPSRIPEHVPAPLDRYFQQAAESCLSGHFDASGAMSRKVVDVSTQQLLKEDAKKFVTIAKRIDELASRSLLTPDLKEWAHQIRLDGNDASHDHDPFSAEQAQGLLDFTELYLTYVYSLPGQLAAKRSPSTPAA